MFLSSWRSPCRPVCDSVPAARRRLRHRRPSAGVCHVGVNRGDHGAAPHRPIEVDVERGERGTSNPAGRMAGRRAERGKTGGPPPKLNPASPLTDGQRMGCRTLPGRFGAQLSTATVPGCGCHRDLGVTESACFVGATWTKRPGERNIGHWPVNEEQRMEDSLFLQKPKP